MALKLGSRGNEVKVLQEKLNLKADGIFGPLTEEAVKDFQRSNGLEVDGIVGANTLSKLNPSVNKRNIKELIVHCSATPEGKDYSVDTIRQWHLQRGFSDIGYHYVIYRDGSIHIGRDESIIGAHCTGHNTNSIGICYIGGCASDGKTPKDTRTTEQKQALVKLLKELKIKYPQASIHGHRDFANKACPSFDATKEYSSL
nr:MAG TPA: endodeoxyribonuclease I [Crassvirales sp.]